jgi:flagellar protein FlaG
METTSISSLASLNNIRTQNKSSYDEGQTSFKEDFSRLPDATINLESNSVQPKAVSDNYAPQSSVNSLASLLDRANDALKSNGARLMFEIDEGSQRPVLFIKDSETMEVIRQVPSDSYLDMSRKITDYLERASAAGLSNQVSPAIGFLTSEVA